MIDEPEKPVWNPEGGEDCNGLKNKERAENGELLLRQSRSMNVSPDIGMPNSGDFELAMIDVLHYFNREGYDMGPGSEDIVDNLMNAHAEFLEQSGCPPV